MRVTWVRSLIIMMATLGLVGCGGAAAPAAPATSSAPASQGAGSAATAGAAVVRLAASQNVTSNAPVWLANEAGIFKKNGLNAQLSSINATAAIKELVAGHIDGLIAGAPEAISARAAGSPLTIVAVFQNSYDQVLVVPKGITSPEQIKGKSVAVITKPSVNGVGTVAALRKYGLEPDRDYKIIETGSAGTYAAMAAALEAHKVDVGALQPNFARKLEQDGQFTTLFDLAKVGLLTAGSTLTFQTPFVQQHPDEVQKTLDSLLQGQAYFKEHRAEAEGVLRKTFKITDQVDVDEGYQRQVDLFAKDPTPRLDLFPDLVKALGDQAPAVKTLDLSSLIDPRFAQNAVKRGLTNY